MALGVGSTSRLLDSNEEKCNIQHLERVCRNSLQKSKDGPRSKYCPYVMALKDAENKLVAFECKLESLREEAPFLQSEHQWEIFNKIRKEGNKNKERALLTILKKEYDRKKTGSISACFGKTASNTISWFNNTSRKQNADIIQGEKDTLNVCTKGIGKRNTSGNASPFAQGDLLDDL